MPGQGNKREGATVKGQWAVEESVEDMDRTVQFVPCPAVVRSSSCCFKNRCRAHLQMVGPHAWLRTVATVARSWERRAGQVMLLLLLLSFVAARATAQETCGPQRIQMTIRYRDCEPRNVLLYGCSGMCTSYSQPNVNNPLQLERSCRCCRELGRRKVAVVLRCPRANASRGIRRLVRRMRVPVRCACRPCSGYGSS